MQVGILGLGTYLPPTIRTNAWWPPDVLADWHERMASIAMRGEAASSDLLTSGAVRTLEAMGAYAADPFRGAVERHVMSDDQTAPEMEAHAAREAIERAGLRVDQIDMLLTQTPVPEHLLTNSAGTTHRLLDLPRHCLALGTESACNGFGHHLALARGMIASGRARHVLSVHSSAMTRILKPAEPDSPWWGDGAAAVVFGPVSDDKGVLADQHYADGTACHALVLGVPGRRWWEAGEIVLHSVDRQHTRMMVMSLLDRGRDAIARCLAEAGLTTEDVEFFATHQGTAWFTRATAEHAGVEHARTVVTFPQLGNLNSANIPVILAMAERDGLLRDGSVVVTFSGGVGETWSGVCLRWGR